HGQTFWRHVSANGIREEFGGEIEHLSLSVFSPVADWCAGGTMCRRRFLSWAVLIAVFLASVLPVSAQSLRYLPLQQAGQASVAIDETKSTAYVIDLGKAGDG